MRKLAKHPKLREAITQAAGAVWSINWNTTFGIPHGACIPISVFTVAYLDQAGIASRVVEAGAQFTDPLSKRYSLTETIEPIFEARDEPGLDFLGHAVIQVPTHRAVLDLSLPTQQSKVIKSLGMVEILVGEVDHTKGQVGFKTPFGRGEAVYRIYPRRDGWTKRAWPFGEIREAAKRAYRHEDEFEFLKEMEFE